MENSLQNTITKYNNEIKALKKISKKLEYERDCYFCECYPWLKLVFKKYVGSYNIKSKKLILHHFTDAENICPYGDCALDDRKIIKVKGSWDNWEKTYELKEKIVRDADDLYEGHIYYINVDLDITLEYQFKFIDINGAWVEPVSKDACGHPLIEDSLANLLVNVVKDNNGIWNANIKIRPYENMKNIPLIWVMD